MIFRFGNTEKTKYYMHILNMFYDSALWIYIFNTRLLTGIVVTYDFNDKKFKLDSF